jgi:hypothetical protein
MLKKDSVFFFKMKNNKIFAVEFFRVFLTMYVYSNIEIDQILVISRNQSVESNSV